MPSTVAIECPRCAQDIECRLEITETRRSWGLGSTVDTEARVRDLGERMARHYAEMHA